MVILPVHEEVIDYLKKRRLFKKFEKQCEFLKTNPNHPSLNVEILEPRWLKIFSFRIDKKYRASFIFRGPDLIEILEVNNHYR